MSQTRFELMRFFWTPPQEFRVDSLECFLLNLVRVVKGGTVIGAEILNGVKMYLGKYLLNLG